MIYKEMTMGIHTVNERILEESIRTRVLLIEILKVLNQIEQKSGPSDNPFKTYG